MEAETSRVDVTVPEPVLVVPVLPLAESRSAVWRIVERALEISIAGLLPSWWPGVRAGGAALRINSPLDWSRRSAAGA